MVTLAGLLFWATIVKVRTLTKFSMNDTKRGCNPTVSLTLLGLRTTYIFYLGRRALACVECIAKQEHPRISNIHVSKLIPQYWWWNLVGFASRIHQFPVKEKAVPQGFKPWLHSQLYILDTLDLPGLGSGRHPVPLGKWWLSFLLLERAGFSKDCITMRESSSPWP